MKLYDETDCLPHVKPAFPFAATDPSNVAMQASGLTKREYAAIHIAAAIEARNVSYGPGDIAKRAVALADAVLREAGE